MCAWHSMAILTIQTITTLKSIMSTSFSLPPGSSVFYLFPSRVLPQGLCTCISLSMDLALKHPGLGASLGSLLPFTFSQRPPLTSWSQVPLL